MSLDVALSLQLIPSSVRHTIISAIFDTTAHDTDVESLSAYFQHWYEDQCRHLASNREISIRTHQELVEIVALLKTEDNSRLTVKNKLSLGPSAPEAQKLLLDGSIDLAARILLLLSIGAFRQSQTIGRNLEWREGSLQSKVAEIFPKSEFSGTIRLPRIFNASNLEKLAGLKIRWTSNLADHLLLSDDNQMVDLFHQVTALRLHHTCVGNLLPPGLIDETEQTLGLLLPYGEKDCKQWFKRKQEEHELDPNAGSCRQLNNAARHVENFQYWRDRLVILKQTFDEKEPQTISQWWYDDRKKVQWYTFWVAVLVLGLTIVFGLIQSIASIYQAWASGQALGQLSMPPSPPS